MHHFLTFLIQEFIFHTHCLPYIKIFYRRLCFFQSLFFYSANFFQSSVNMLLLSSCHLLLQDTHTLYMPPHHLNLLCNASLIPVRLLFIISGRLSFIQIKHTLKHLKKQKTKKSGKSESKHLNCANKLKISYV